MGNARTGNNFYQTARGRNARNIANRYTTNIANVRGMTTTRNGVPFVNNTRRVSRAIYMGLSNG